MRGPPHHHPDPIAMHPPGPVCGRPVMRLSIYLYVDLLYLSIFLSLYLALSLYHSLYIYVYVYNDPTQETIRHERPALIFVLNMPFPESECDCSNTIVCELDLWLFAHGMTPFTMCIYMTPAYDSYHSYDSF